jgi:hypothetical protein
VLRVGIVLERVRAEAARAFLIVDLHRELAKLRAEAIVEHGLHREILEHRIRIRMARTPALQELALRDRVTFIDARHRAHLLEQLARGRILRFERQRFFERIVRRIRLLRAQQRASQRHVHRVSLRRDLKRVPVRREHEIIATERV